MSNAPRKKKKTPVARAEKPTLPKAGDFTPKKQASAGPGIFSNFESAKFSNKRSWIWSSWPQDFKKTMTVFDRMETTRRMRYLELNAGLIRQAIGDMALYSVGSGIKPQAESGDEVWDDAAEAYFREWAEKNTDITGRYSLFELQHIVCRLMDRDGECFIVKTRGPGGAPKLQVIESHRVGNAASGAPPPGMVDGIMFGPYGAPVYYNILRSDGSSRQVPANAVLHLYEPELASGARAYSPLQHSINNIIDMMEILSLEKLAVKTSSDITRTITRENPQFDGSQSDFEAFGMRPQDYGNNGLTDPNEASTFIGGKILSLAPGEKLESFESSRPNQAFTGFIDHLIRDSLSGFLPYEFTYDPTKIGGASVRLIIAKADRKFQHRQSILIQRFLTPVWGYVIGNAIKDGIIPANDYWHRVQWTTPRRVTVDTGRDAIANRADIKAGLKSWTQHQLEMGNDPKAVARELFAEKAHFKQLAEEFGLQVSSAIMPENVAPSDVDAAYQSDDEKEKAAMDDGAKIEADPDDPNVGPDPLNEPSDE